MALAEAGSDEFGGEKIAMEIESRLRAVLKDGRLPIARDCRGASPLPREYRLVAPDVESAVYGTSDDIAGGFAKWRESLGEVRDARFFSLPGDLVRYDIRSRTNGRLEYRVGWWKQSWTNGSILALSRSRRR